MKAFLLSLALFVLALPALAQTISGRVADADNQPLEGVSVREVRAEGRIINQTRTDASGYFTLALRNTRNALEATLEGYATHREAIDKKRVFKITLTRRAAGAEAFNVRRRETMQTNRLFVGHQDGKEVAWQTWLDQYNDTLVEMVVPVMASTMVDEYPEGRHLYFYGLATKPLVVATTQTAEYPKAGDPNELDTPFWERMHRGDASVAIADGTPRLCYFYPKFLLSLADLARLAKEAETIVSITTDNAPADNTYQLYPAASFAKELRKYASRVKAK